MKYCERSIRVGLTGYAMFNQGVDDPRKDRDAGSQTRFPDTSPPTIVLTVQAPWDNSDGWQELAI